MAACYFVSMQHIALLRDELQEKRYGYGRPEIAEQRLVCPGHLTVPFAGKPAPTGVVGPGEAREQAHRRLAGGGLTSLHGCGVDLHAHHGDASPGSTVFVPMQNTALLRDEL